MTDYKPKRYRTGPASAEHHRDFHNFYVGRHRAGLFTPREETVPAIRERHEGVR